MTVSVGSNLGPYRIIEPLGRGGMASVYKAYEASLDRYIALKVLPPEFLHDPTFAERFRREAQTVARLEHPQIIPIFAYDIDAETGTPWMAMRLISGGSLSQRIKRGRLDPDEIARIVKEVAGALDYAHAAGVVHRDVKPQNVLLDDAGRVYLADFGIAKMVEASDHLTQTGMMTGTPQYMAPELALGRTIDASIDIYALGIVAYELFTGRVPFSADTPLAVLMKQASEPMPLPPVSEVKEEVTRAILRATAKDPLARWPTASAFARAIANATPSVEADAATSVLSAIKQEPIQVITVTTPAASSGTVSNQTDAPPAGLARIPVESSRRAGSGMGVAAAMFVGLALLGAVATYLGYGYFLSSRTVKTPIPSALSVATPAGPEPAAVVGVGAPVAETAPVPSAPGAPTAKTTTASATASAEDIREPLTPAQRGAAMGRDPGNRGERVLTPAEARLQPESTPLRGDVPAASSEGRPVATPARKASHTRIMLEVEASQPSTGTQIRVLYAQVLIDDRPFRDFIIRFTGSNSFARWKKVENIALEGVPLSARVITLAVATDPDLNEDRIDGSTRLSLEGNETSLSVEVRFYNQFDKSVRFR